jgi:hypothetical protein
MRSLSGCLAVLIATAEDVMRKPQDLPARLPDEFAELAAEIRDYDRRPAEGVRCTQGAMIMVTAIEAFFGLGTYHWQIIVGATLPILRREYWQATQNEKSAREARD